MATSQLAALELVESDCAVSVEFNDGHLLRFVPLNILNPGQGLRNVQLWNLTEQVAQFDFARHRDNDLRVGQYSLAKGYTLEKLREYSLVAHDFIKLKFKSQKVPAGFYGYDVMAYCMFAMSKIEYVAAHALVCSRKTNRLLRNMGGKSMA